MSASNRQAVDVEATDPHTSPWSRSVGDDHANPPLGGSSQDRFSWTRNEKRLAPLSAVVTVDLPGYGDADFLPADHGIDFLADAVRHTSSSPPNVRALARR